MQRSAWHESSRSKDCRRATLVVRRTSLKTTPRLRLVAGLAKRPEVPILVTAPSRPRLDVVHVQGRIRYADTASLSVTGEDGLSQPAPFRAVRRSSGIELVVRLPVFVSRSALWQVRQAPPERSGFDEWQLGASDTSCRHFRGPPMRHDRPQRIQERALRVWPARRTQCAHPAMGAQSSHGDVRQRHLDESSHS